jgi:hypothetical protein
MERHISFLSGERRTTRLNGKRGGVEFNCLMRSVLVFLFMAVQLRATWERVVITPKEERTETNVQEAYPLSYFTQYPGLRIEDIDFCAPCVGDRCEQCRKALQAKVELTLVGTLEGFPIYDLYYHVDGWSTETKLILVKTGPDRYREIHHCEPLYITPARSALITVRGQRLLNVHMDAIRNADPTDDYFWFDHHGAHLVDFRPVVRAVKSAFPKQATPAYIQDELAVPATGHYWHFGAPLVYKTVIDNITVTVRFEFDRGQVVVTGASSSKGM